MVLTLNRVVWVDFVEKLTFGQRLERSEGIGM